MDYRIFNKCTWTFAACDYTRGLCTPIASQRTIFDLDLEKLKFSLCPGGCWTITHWIYGPVSTTLSQPTTRWVFSKGRHKIFHVCSNLSTCFALVDNCLVHVGNYGFRADLMGPVNCVISEFDINYHSHGLDDVTNTSVLSSHWNSWCWWNFIYCSAQDHLLCLSETLWQSCCACCAFGLNV